MKNVYRVVLEINGHRSLFTITARTPKGAENRAVALAMCGSFNLKRREITVISCELRLRQGQVA